MVANVKQCRSCGRKYATEIAILQGTSRWRICEREYFWFNCQCGSTLTLKPGEVSWFTPLSDSGAGSLLNLLGHRDKFPYLPSSIAAIRSVCEDEDASTADIAVTIKQDPVVAAGILSVANNMKVGMGSVASLEHAVTYIGRDLVKHIALTVAVKNIPVQCVAFDAAAFWQEAFLTGSIAENLASNFAKHLKPDEVYIAGALCNVGKIVGAVYVPKTVDGLYKQTAHEEGVNWPEAESFINHFNHTKLGEFAIFQWGFPDYIGSVVSAHHSPPETNDSQRAPTIEEIVAFANQIMHIVLEQEHRIQDSLLAAYQERFALDDDDFDMLLGLFASAKSRTQQLVADLTTG